MQWTMSKPRLSTMQFEGNVSLSRLVTESCSRNRSGGHDFGHAAPAKITALAVGSISPQRLKPHQSEF